MRDNDMIDMPREQWGGIYDMKWPQCGSNTYCQNQNLEF